MPALPRPDLPPGAHRDLVEALHELHHRAGWPSLRSLAKAAGCSHTTVSTVFSSPKLPTWGNIEVLVDAMHGDAGQFHRLWVAASGPEPGSAPAQISGRRTEVSAVRRHLETGNGLLLVTGEAGIGKTTVVTAAESTVEAFVARGRCHPLSTQVPLLPLADVLRTCWDADEGIWVTKAMESAAGYVSGALSPLLPELDDGQSTSRPDVDSARRRLFTAIDGGLRALGRVRPLAVVLEDLHWADPTTLDALMHLVGRPGAVAVVGTWRTDDPDVPEPALDWLAHARRAATATVEVTELSREETRDQLAMLQVPADDLYLEQIYSRSRGQPLFTEQLAAQSAADESLPRALTEVLDRRLGTLDRAAWSVVRLLGVADRPMPADALDATTGPAELGDVLRKLVTQRLVVSSGDDVSLAHPLLAEAVRRRLAPGESRSIHRDVALLLAELPDPSPAEIASHWRVAREPDHELGWQISAAREARARLALPEELESWRRVLELWPPEAMTAGDPALSKPRVWVAAIEAAAATGRADVHGSLVEVARREADAWPDADRAELLRLAALYLEECVGPGAGDALIDEALAVYRRLPPSEGLVHTLDLAAHLREAVGDVSGASALYDDALRVVREIGPSPLERGLLASIAWHKAQTGRLEDALDLIRKVATMRGHGPEPERDLWVAVVHTDILLMAARPASELASAAGPALDTAKAAGIDSDTSNVLPHNVATSWLLEGRVDEAARLLDPATVGEPLSPHRWALDAARAELDMVRGRTGDARQRLDALTRTFASTGDLLAPSLAALQLWEGAPDLALAGILRAFSGDHREFFGETGGCMALAARAAADVAAREKAGADRRATLGEQLLALRNAAHQDPFDADAVPADRLYASQWFAELARVDGKATVELWSDAAAEWDAASRPHDAAYCRWRGAQVALARGQRTVAARMLKRASRDAREHVPLSAAIAATAGASGIGAVTVR